MYTEILEHLAQSYYAYRRADLYEQDLPTVDKIEKMLHDYLEYLNESRDHICENILDMDF